MKHAELIQPLRLNFACGGLLCALAIFMYLPSLAHAESPGETNVVSESATHETSSVVIANYIEQYKADLETLRHRYRVPLDIEAEEMRTSTTQSWLDRLTEVDFSALGRVDQIDYLLLKSELQYQLDKQLLDRARDGEASKLLPYAAGLVAFLKNR